MALSEAYINNTGSLSKFLESIKTAGVPERVTVEFLKALGFKSSNDRPIISVFKGIGFLDANGTPTELYKGYRGHDGPRILANALRSSYSELFLAHTQAQSLSIDKIKGIIASKSNKGDTIVERIARTFHTLAKTADFSSEATTTRPRHEEPPEVSKPPAESEQAPIRLPQAPKAGIPEFHYNIEIHLPTTTDITVYNAIFKSLKENLL